MPNAKGQPTRDEKLAQVWESAKRAAKDQAARDSSAREAKTLRLQAERLARACGTEPGSRRR